MNTGLDDGLGTQRGAGAGLPAATCEPRTCRRAATACARAASTLSGFVVRPGIGAPVGAIHGANPPEPARRARQLHPYAGRSCFVHRRRRDSCPPPTGFPAQVISPTSVVQRAGGPCVLLRVLTRAAQPKPRVYHAPAVADTGSTLRRCRRACAHREFEFTLLRGEPRPRQVISLWRPPMEVIAPP
jgi:hypothetical protein